MDEKGTLTVGPGDTRVYLVKDHTRLGWSQHEYVRLDLQRNPLTYTLDLSNVPCGCLACVYMVAMDDSDVRRGSNYCDMAENKNAGFGGGMLAARGAYSPSQTCRTRYDRSRA